MEDLSLPSSGVFVLSRQLEPSGAEREMLTALAREDQKEMALQAGSVQIQTFNPLHRAFFRFSFRLFFSLFHLSSLLFVHKHTHTLCFFWLFLLWCSLDFLPIASC